MKRRPFGGSGCCAGSPRARRIGWPQRSAGRTVLGQRQPLARGIEARSRALLTHGPGAEELYLEAIEQLGRSRVVVHHARAQLIYASGFDVNTAVSMRVPS